MPHNIARGTIAWIWLAVASVWATTTDTIYTSPPLTAAQRTALLSNLNSRRTRIQQRAAGLEARECFTFALESAEARYGLDRIDLALETAELMQDRVSTSPTYGNLRWRWGDAAPDDRNAVEFSMQDGALLWMRHRDVLSSAALASLTRLIDFGVEGIRRHNVRESYTNIFLMKTWNCIALGEHAGRPDLARAGYAMLDAWLIYTWENGIHEYISPTYYGVDLDSLGLIARFAGSARARQQAEVALRLFWTDIAFNWFLPDGRLGGSHSRDYDYLTGHGALDPHLQYAGWLSASPSTRPQRFAALAGWKPPAELRDLAAGRVPRMIRQQWGSRAAGEFSAHWVGRAIDLGTAGACYGSMDKPLTVNFNGGWQMPMVNSFLDARNDPYGLKREVTGGGHLKALHLIPFLMSVQRATETLVLASASPADASFRQNAPTPSCLLTQLVLPRSGVELWIGDQRVDLASQSSSRSVEIDEAVFVRYGDGVAGFRVLHATDLQGATAPLELRYDILHPPAMSLTAVHAPTTPTQGRATVALYAAVAEGADVLDFGAWRRRFAETAAQASFASPVLEAVAQGAHGALRIRGNVQTGERLAVEGEEDGAAGRLLSIDGDDEGRRILESIEPVAALARLFDGLDTSTAVAIDRPYEAERAPIVVPPFEVGADLGASGGRYVWMPSPPGTKGSSSVARAVYPIYIPRAGTYYVVARVRTPTPEDDSFFLQIRTRDADLLPRIDWHTGTHAKWEWTLFRRQSDKTSAIVLPAGPALLEFWCREDGSALDAFAITTRPDWIAPTRAKHARFYSWSGFVH